MSTQKTAVVIGVGAQEGLGAYLCRRAAEENLHVIVAGRTQDKLDEVVQTIEEDGGRATAIASDATIEVDVVDLLSSCEAIGPIELAIYNAGNNMPGDFLDMEASYFEQCWRVACFGGFLFARESLRHMAPRGTGSLFFTGASASLRGKPGFAAFTAAKAGLRTMAQSLAREFNPQGIHVAQVMIDGGIYGERIRSRYPERVNEVGPAALVGLDGLADAYMYLHNQPRNAWTHELDLRTHVEKF